MKVCNIDGNRREILHESFRRAVKLVPVTFLPPIESSAEDQDDLTSKMFNSDGSLKEGVASVEAASRPLETTWPISSERIINVDGKNFELPEGAKRVRITYKVPTKWQAGYLDMSEGVDKRACKQIVVYQAPGLASVDRIQRASAIGVGKSLDVPDVLKLDFGDIIGGRQRDDRDSEHSYYDFEIATAPKTCEPSQKNLGLGFCPYDTIFLLSATILEHHLYVLAVECDDDQWKLASSDLKRVRSSFHVETV